MPFVLRIKNGSDLSSHSHKNLFYGRRRETKFPIKFFAKLSFKKAGKKLFCLLFSRKKQVSKPLGQRALHLYRLSGGGVNKAQPPGVEALACQAGHRLF